MLTKEDKEFILNMFKNVDVKKLQLDHPDQKLVKWFRFGSFTGLDIATEIIKSLPEKKTTKKIDKTISYKVS